MNKVHKNFEKSAQKFFAAPSVAKTSRNISIFYPYSVDGPPPPRGGTPPITMIDTVLEYYRGLKDIGNQNSI